MGAGSEGARWPCGRRTRLLPASTRESRFDSQALRSRSGAADFRAPFCAVAPALSEVDAD